MWKQGIQKAKEVFMKQNCARFFNHQIYFTTIVYQLHTTYGLSELYLMHVDCSDVPKAFLEDFVDKSDSSLYNMAQLKNRIRTSGLELFDK